jgi:DNA-binding transcriptional regulator YhcF (GntR family)
VENRVNVEIDPSSPTPPYEQIRSQVATLIEAGRLAPGTSLPTIRQLANDLGLATRTVARAYHELEAAGLVISRVRHGTSVASPRHRLSTSEIQLRLTEAARSYLRTSRLLGVCVEDAIQALRSVG